MSITIDNKMYLDLFQLGKDISLKPKVFFNELQNNEELARFINTCDQKKYDEFLKINPNSGTPDEYLFRVSYLFNPHQTLKYHTYEFANVKDIGRVIVKFAPKVDVYIKDLLEKSLLLQFITMKEYDKTQPEFYDKILELTNMSKTNPNIAYFRLGFFLYGTENISYDGKIFKNYKDFARYILAGTELKSRAAEVEKSGYLIALQIETSKSPNVYKRYAHTLKIFQDKRKRYELEQKLANEKHKVKK